MGGSQMQSCRLLSIIVTGLLFLMSLSGYCFGEELSVTMLNVGQADAFLVQTAGKRVLIDAGETATQVRNILKSKGIANLDLIVATHPHSDHIGGMKNVVDGINFKVYMDRTGSRIRRQLIQNSWNRSRAKSRAAKRDI